MMKKLKKLKKLAKNSVFNIEKTLDKNRTELKTKIEMK
jgi:hypothetical protein